MNHDILLPVVTGVLELAPQWVRDDLAAKNPSRRSRAEESLAAMIVAALRDRERDGPVL